MIDKIWNKKAAGVLPALALFLNILINTILDYISKYLAFLAIEDLGQNVSFQKGFKYRYPKNISLGNNCCVGRNVEFSTEILDGMLRIKDNVQINRNCFIDFSGGVYIDSNALISDNVKIYTHTHGLNPRSCPRGIPLEIGKNVWLGAASSIMHNVTRIGENSIVAANSVVTKNVPSNVIVAGSPAKVIKQL